MRKYIRSEKQSVIVIARGILLTCAFSALREFIMWHARNLWIWLFACVCLSIALIVLRNQTSSTLILDYLLRSSFVQFTIIYYLYSMVTILYVVWKWSADTIIPEQLNVNNQIVFTRKDQCPSLEDIFVSLWWISKLTAIQYHDAWASEHSILDTYLLVALMWSTF